MLTSKGHLIKELLGQYTATSAWLLSRHTEPGRGGDYPCLLGDSLSKKEPSWEDGLAGGFFGAQRKGRGLQIWCLLFEAGLHIAQAGFKLDM